MVLAETKNQGLRIEEGRTKLISTHNKGDLVFLHPVYGPNTYANVQGQIEKDGLVAPTLAETASLVYSAFNSDNKYSQEIQKLMKDRWLWGFTGILYTPKNGVYMQPHPEIRNGMPFMDESELEKKLDANHPSYDPSVRNIPFGFKTGKMSVLELAKNPFVIALAGKEGAEKLADVADKYRNKPYLYSFNSVKEPLTRVSALNPSWSPYVQGLRVFGNIHGNYIVGCAFGVQKTGEASRIK